MNGLRSVGLAICCAAGIGCPKPTTGPTQVTDTNGPRFDHPLTPSAEQGRSLSPAQLDAIVKPNLSNCSPQNMNAKSGRIDPLAVIPSVNAKSFPAARISKSMHGIWRGTVAGDDSDVTVDYFWFIDMNRHEAMIFAQRTGKQTLKDLKEVPRSPHFSFLLCAHEGYFPSKDTPQMQEFVKVSDDLKMVPQLLEAATEMKMRTMSTAAAREGQPNLSEAWAELHKLDYFTKIQSRAKAFGGALFTNMQVAPIQGPIGPPHISISWNGQYYGGGSTAIKWTPGKPINGVEYGTFVGTTATAGDYLVSGPGNGAMWKVEAVGGGGGSYDLGFDSVVFGPMY